MMGPILSFAILCIRTKLFCVHFLLGLFSAHSFYLLYHLFKSRHEPPARTTDVSVMGLPFVTIQLPLYNERFVVERLMAAISKIDYPRDKLEVQVLDDSTDDTPSIITRVLRELTAQGCGVTMHHVRRDARRHYKAGAMADATKTARGEFIAIFDADFVPAPEFLLRTIPHFSRSPSIGVVQTRWAHLNRSHSYFTELQALGHDGHFMVEQEAKWRGGLLLNFNGTAGVWRKACIIDAGGWSGRTLAEDLDLSYRAQIRGWSVRFVRHHAVPAELPADIQAFKTQQARWARGSVQSALYLVPLLWDGPRLLPSHPQSLQQQQQEQQQQQRQQTSNSCSAPLTRLPSHIRADGSWDWQPRSGSVEGAGDSTEATRAALGGGGGVEQPGGGLLPCPSLSRRQRAAGCVHLLGYLCHPLLLANLFLTVSLFVLEPLAADINATAASCAAAAATTAAAVSPASNLTVTSAAPVCAAVAESGGVATAWLMTESEWRVVGEWASALAAAQASALFFIAIGPPLVVVVAQVLLGKPSRLRLMPLLLLLHHGLSVSNSIAVLAVLWERGSHRLRVWVRGLPVPLLAMRVLDRAGGVLQGFSGTVVKSNFGGAGIDTTSPPCTSADSKLGPNPDSIPCESGEFVRTPKLGGVTVDSFAGCSSTKRAGGGGGVGAWRRKFLTLPSLLWEVWCEARAELVMCSVLLAVLVAHGRGIVELELIPTLWVGFFVASFAYVAWLHALVLRVKYED